MSATLQSLTGPKINVGLFYWNPIALILSINVIHFWRKYNLKFCCMLLWISVSFSSSKMHSKNHKILKQWYHLLIHWYTSWARIKYKFNSIPIKWNSRLLPACKKKNRLFAQFQSTVRTMLHLISFFIAILKRTWTHLSNLFSLKIHCGNIPYGPPGPCWPSHTTYASFVLSHISHTTHQGQFTEAN